MSNIRLTIINILLVFFLSFITHFIYDFFPNNIVACFFPINESIFEHLKMAYTTYIIVLLLDYYIFKIRNDNLIAAIYMSALATIFCLIILYPVAFNLFGHNVIITFTVYFVTIIIGNLVGYKILNKKDLYLKDLFMVAIVITFIIFAILTFFPLNINTYFTDYSSI